MRLVKLFGLGVVFIVLVVAASKGGSIGLAQAGCTVTVQPGESIQKAIDEASDGAVICLVEGTWEENIYITKSMKLRGVGPDQSEIKGKVEEHRSFVYKPVIHITSEAEISVDIEELTVNGITFNYGIFSTVFIEGGARVAITNARISGNSGDGVWLKDSAQATIANSFISKSADGIWVTDLARLTITHSVISDSEVGMWLADSAQATIAFSRILNNNAFGIALLDSAQLTIVTSEILHNGTSGIAMSDQAQATITTSQISDNMAGIGVLGLAQLIMKECNISNNRLIGIIIDRGRLTLANSQISNNGWIGVMLNNSAQATITTSLVQYNGVDEASCQQRELYCNGILIGERSQLKLVHSQVIANADWGISAVLKSCSAGINRFPDQVLFEDMALEDISGNNTTGNQNGMGNPGNHPWNRPDVPDGQVCLP